MNNIAPIDGNMADKRGIKIYKKKMPADIYSIILKKQSEIKNDCNCQFSLEKTIYKLIKLAKDLPLK